MHHTLRIHIDLGPDGSPSSPYRTLARFGVNPDSTANAVADASFEMSAEDLANPAIAHAWESLRTTRSRLLVDFFGYELPEPAPAAQTPEAAAPPPLPYGFLCRLARAVELPPALQKPPAPRAEDQLPPTLQGEAPLWEPGLDPTQETSP
jgi:hypothetical protein